VTSDSRSGDEYERDVRALFEHAVRDEIAVAFGMQRIEVSDTVMESVANAVISRIEYGFRYRWDPVWVKDGPHEWAEDGRFYARCNACLASRDEASAEDARAWYSKHVSEAHDV
jgi:hypothetical protein